MTRPNARPPPPQTRQLRDEAAVGAGRDLVQKRRPERLLVPGTERSRPPCCTTRGLAGRRRDREDHRERQHRLQVPVPIVPGVE